MSYNMSSTHCSPGDDWSSSHWRSAYLSNIIKGDFPNRKKFLFTFLTHIICASTSLHNFLYRQLCGGMTTPGVPLRHRPSNKGQRNFLLDDLQQELSLCGQFSHIAHIKLGCIQHKDQVADSIKLFFNINEGNSTLCLLRFMFEMTPIVACYVN